MKQTLNRWIHRLWYQRAAHPLLTPLAGLFSTLAQRRKRKQSQRASPTLLRSVVVVVGNISVGGSGKTPVVATIVRAALDAGIAVGVLSRGYGGKAEHYPHRVSQDDSPRVTGDEPLMLAQQFSVPVVVDPQRLRGALYLQNQCGVSLIVCDDGLQHYRLPRDIEIAVIDARAGFGNGELLPAGPLREPPQRLETVDHVLCHGDPSGVSDAIRATVSQWYRVTPVDWSNLATGQTRSLEAGLPLADKPVAVTGIGQPQGFFGALDELGVAHTPVAFPDHHPFTEQDLAPYTQPLVMTAKDAVKCREFAKPDWWQLNVIADLDAAWLQQLLTDVRTLSAQKAKH